MIRPYSHASHFALMKAWCDERGQEGLLPEFLPMTGLVADEKAIAFLVETDAVMSWIAHFCCDPKLEKKDRDRLFEEVIQGLEEIARKRGYLMIQTCAKQNKNMKPRIEGQGYQSFGEFEFFAKRLR